MPDFMDKWNDKILDDLEKEIVKTFNQAITETKAKEQEVIKAFEIADNKKLESLKKGIITEKEYSQWRSGQLFKGKRYNELINSYISTIERYTTHSLTIINETTPNVFIQNGNYTAYKIENGAKIDFGFSLWNEKTIELLIKEKNELLPKKKTLNIAKDKLWNIQSLRRQIEQGILQGESLPKIAKRFETVTNMNKNQALANAKTAMTGAQNGGRLERMIDAEENGVIVKKVWDAVMDNRTRDSHRELDGTVISIHKEFEVKGEKQSKLLYPGDITANPGEIYNCRCVLNEVYEGYTGKAVQNKYNSEKYKKWKQGVSI